MGAFCVYGPSPPPPRPSPSSPKTFVSGANGVWGGPAAYSGKQFPGSVVHKNLKGVKKTTRIIAFSAR